MYNTDFFIHSLNKKCRQDQQDQQDQPVPPEEQVPREPLVRQVLLVIPVRPEEQVPPVLQDPLVQQV